MKKYCLVMFFALVACAAPSGVFAAEQTVTVYAARYGSAEKELYAAFREQTGIAVTVVEGKAGELLKRMRDEGTASQADLFTAVDGGILHSARESGVLRPIPANALENIPESLRDKDSFWVGLSTRARVIVYSKERVSANDLSTYEDLAAPKWKGRVVQRPGSSLYNISLLASLIALDGEAKTAAFVQGMAQNFARPPKGGDRGQAEDIAAGRGDVTFMNTYYIGRMLHSSKPEEVEAAQKVGVFFPNQNTTGVHINVSGIGLAKYAKNIENAVKLIAFMTSVPAQERLAAATYEFPANPNAKKPALLESWGAFKAQTIDFAVLAENKRAAERLAGENGWGE